MIARTTTLTAWQRWAFGALATLSPVLWYLDWTGPEVQSWAGVTIALAFLSQRRYPLAALFAALAAWQNPPLLPLVGTIALLALTTHTRRTIFATWAVTAIAPLPSVFTLLYFGTPNLIATVGMADPHLASASRTWSLFTDLNQGMLPFVPLLLVLTIVAVTIALVRRQWVGLLIAATLLAIVLLSESTTNWNSGCFGMMRYTIWMIPLLAWLVATHLPTRFWSRAGIIIAAALQLTILFVPGMGSINIHQLPLARLALTYTPMIYNPEPEIFIERQAGTEDGAVLPVAFATADGVVTKILTDAASIRQLPVLYRVDASYFQQVVAAHREETGMFYLTPPVGAIYTR